MSAAEVEANVQDGVVPGIDPYELEDWYESLDDVLHRYGPERTQQLLVALRERAYHDGVMMPFMATTPYKNTIHVHEEPQYPGDLQMERRIKSLVRWNAMAMVHRANRDYKGVGGHISTFASAATLYEVGPKSLLQRPNRESNRRHGLLPRACQPGDVLACVS